MYAPNAGCALNKLVVKQEAVIGGFILNKNIRVPLFLSLELWKRHKYSIKDIETTLYFFTPYLLWQAALLFGILPVASSVKLSFSNPSSMVFCAKSIVCNKIMNAVKETGLFKGNRSVLDTKREQHIPPIPIHTVPYDTYSLFSKSLPRDLHCLLSTIEVERIFDWKDIQMVPLWYEDGAIYCVRVIPVHQFIGSDDEPMVSQPLKIKHKHQWYLGVEESWLIDVDKGEDGKKENSNQKKKKKGKKKKQI